MVRGYGITLEDKGQRMFLAYGDTWKHVLKYLNSECPDSISCPICLEELNKHGETVLTCHECMVGVCRGCTIKQVVAKSGVMVCCNCRYSIGTRMPTYLVHRVAQSMRLKLALGGIV